MIFLTAEQALLIQKILLTVESEFAHNGLDSDVDVCK